jgi:S-disulfanyl-L-cysteine oxidoreductase SoxD
MSRVLPALLLVAIFSAPLQAQNGKGASTMSGVYTREQSARGMDVYVGMCKSCHTPESHTAETFTSKWKGKPLSELYVYIRDEMPKSAPGSLSEAEYADILAYMLRLNRLPAGDDELPADTDRLKTIRFETARKAAQSPPPVRKDP